MQRNPRRVHTKEQLDLRTHGVEDCTAADVVYQTVCLAGTRRDDLH